MVKTYDPLRAKARASVSVALSFVLGLGIASLFGFTDRPFGGFEIQTAPPVSDAEVQPALDLSEAFVNAAGAVTPAVVRIETSRTQTASGDRTGLEWFFRGQAPDPEIVQGSGSGFLIAENGYVLTNNHVVEDATSITVKMLDGREFGADIVGTDPTTDIAVIRVDGTGFPVASLGTSADVRVGEWVLAVGNPGFSSGGTNLDYTVTAGIVSAKGRSLTLINRSLREDPDYNANPGFAIEDFIQTDAVINSGNSGGPMVNLHGQVIGINSAIVSRTGVYQGYGFAIPIDLAHRVMEDLIAYGRVRRAYLGVSMQGVTAEDAEKLGLPEVRGALVQSVSPESPAQEAGIQPFDVIVSIDGEQVLSGNDLQHKVALKAPGDRVRIGVYRDERPREFTARLEELPLAGEVAAAPAPRPRAADRLGIDRMMDVDELPPELADRIPVDEGVVVLGVTRSGPAIRRGLQEGCVMTRIEGRQIRSNEDVDDALAGVGPGEVASVIAACESRGWELALYNIRLPR